MFEILKEKGKLYQHEQNTIVEENFKNQHLNRALEIRIKHAIQLKDGIILFLPYTLQNGHLLLLNINDIALSDFAGARCKKISVGRDSAQILDAALLPGSSDYVLILFSDGIRVFNTNTTKLTEIVHTYLTVDQSMIQPRGSLLQIFA